MVGRRQSEQTRAVLAELASEPSRERHGYDLARATGLASGTLYPILMRLEERGLLEARWELEPSRRPRHVYRLTAAGLEAATAPAEGVSARVGKEAFA